MKKERSETMPELIIKNKKKDKRNFIFNIIFVVYCAFVAGFFFCRILSAERLLISKICFETNCICLALQIYFSICTVKRIAHYEKMEFELQFIIPIYELLDR